MKSLKNLIFILAILFNTNLFAQQSLIDLANTMTKEQIWSALITPNSSGETIFGKCRIGDATGNKCPQCACNYYFKGAKLGSLGLNGWPKNPNSGDGTGCFQWKNGSPACWPGYPSNCSTASSQDLAKAILMDALSKNDVCGLPTKPTIKGGISVTDSSNFLFVDPGASCAKGKVLCGSTKVGSEVAGMSQFTQFPEKFCKVAYGSAKKSTNNKAKMITCDQYNSSLISTQIIQQAASMVGQMNQGYDVFDQLGIAEFLNYTPAQLNNMPFEDVALYYVVVGKNSNKLPQELKARVIPENFEKTRANGDKWIVSAEITAAETKLSNIQKGVIPPQNLTLDQAVQILQSSNQKQ